MLSVHGMSASGNCYKVRLLLEQLGQPYQWHEVDVVGGATRTPAFLAMNPFGQVPVLEHAPGQFLPESGAILCYLAEGTPFWPGERLARAATLRWMFFEQYSHEPYIAVARYIRSFLPADHPRRADLPRLHERGNEALRVMERHLAANEWFAAGRYTIADIALFAYTHAAADGGFDLGNYPAIGRWLERVRAEPRWLACRRR
ncbi:MAG: glutathione S-transferase family protein [Steroidobacteraceae bacterium]